MRKIKILLSMIYPLLILMYLFFSDTVTITDGWDLGVILLSIVLFAMFFGGLVAFIVCLVKDFIKWIKSRKQPSDKE